MTFPHRFRCSLPIRPRYTKLIPAMTEWSKREVVEDAAGAMGYHFVQMLDGATDVLVFPTGALAWSLRRSGPSVHPSAHPSIRFVIAYVGAEFIVVLPD